MRTNAPQFGKRTPLTRDHFAEFEKAFHICLPPLEEQREIVRVVRARLAVIDRVVVAAEQARESSQSLDASILAKAFRRELVG